MTPYQRIRALPRGVQLAGGSALILILGALTPWLKYGGSYASGLSLNSGELAILIGGLVIFLLSRTAARSRAHDSGETAALGLLAVGIVAVVVIHYAGKDAYSLAWGIWVSAIGAVGLLVGGLAMLGSPGDSLGPPD